MLGDIVAGLRAPVKEFQRMRLFPHRVCALALKNSLISAKIQKIDKNSIFGYHRFMCATCAYVHYYRGLYRGLSE